MFKAVLLSLCVLGVSLAAQADVRAEIDARNAEWTGAFNRGDVDAVVAIYDEGFIAIPSMGEAITDREEFRKLIADAIANFKDMKFTTLSLKVHGDYAYELGRSTYTIVADDGTETPAGDDYVAVWKRGEDGVWNYHVDVFWGSESDE